MDDSHIVSESHAPLGSKSCPQILQNYHYDFESHRQNRCQLRTHALEETVKILPAKKRTYSEFIQSEEGEEEEQPKKKVKLRKRIQKIRLKIPMRNKVPSMFIPKKTNDRRGKITKKEREEKERQFFLKQGLDNNNNWSEEYGINSRCSCCHSDGDRFFIHDYKSGDTICTNCSVVQSKIHVGEDYNPRKMEAREAPQKRTLPTSSREAYLAEKIRLFCNAGPPIPEQDLSSIRSVYQRLRDDYNSNYSVLKGLPHRPRIRKILRWFQPREEDITKKNVKGLLDFIDKDLEAVKEKGFSFRKKYLERWTQIKAYFCGNHYYYKFIADKVPERIRDYLLKMSILVSNVYDDHYDEIFGKEPDCFGLCPPKKKNIPNLDVLLLMLLYGDTADDSVEAYGWYFVNPNMHNVINPDSKVRKKSEAVLRSFEAHRKILTYINNHYQAILSDILFEASIEPTNTLQLPVSLEQLIQIASQNKAAYQF